MASFPKPGKDSVHDFDANEYNTVRDDRTFPDFGNVKAGVEFGLSSVERNKRGEIQAQQKTDGSVFRQDCMDEDIASDFPGKSFKIRY